MVDLSSLKIIRARRKSISLQILHDGTIQVRAPFLMPTIFIKKFVQKHSDWIEDKVKVAQKNVKIKKHEHGSNILFLGKEYKLHIGNFSKIELTEDKLCFPKALEFRMKKELDVWYKSQAKKIISSHVDEYSKQMQASYVSISFSDTKSKWGSCSHDNRLQFNWRLVMTPLLVLRYVVIHELAHTKEKNHSRSFWSKVALFNPSYKQQIKWLKIHGDALFI